MKVRFMVPFSARRTIEMSVVIEFYASVCCRFITFLCWITSKRLSWLIKMNYKSQKSLYSCWKAQQGDLERRRHELLNEMLLYMPLVVFQSSQVQGWVRCDFCVIGLMYPLCISFTSCSNERFQEKLLRQFLSHFIINEKFSIIHEFCFAVSRLNL